MPVCLLMRDRKGVNLDRRGGREEQGGLVIVHHNILYEKNLFQKERKKTEKEKKKLQHRCMEKIEETGKSLQIHFSSQPSG